MRAAGEYYVCILASRGRGTLYIGVTNNLRKRLEQHRSGHGSEFVKKYGVHRVVHMEGFASPQDAIAREKQLRNADATGRFVWSKSIIWTGETCPISFNAGGYGSRPAPGRRQPDMTLFNAHIADSILSPQ
jgi:putative endonuclease